MRAPELPIACPRATAPLCESLTRVDGSRNNIPVDINLGGINLQLLFGDADDNGEGLIYLEERDVFDLQVGFLEGFWEGDGGGGGKVNWVNTSIRESYSRFRSAV